MSRQHRAPHAPHARNSLAAAPRRAPDGPWVKGAAARPAGCEASHHTHHCTRDVGRGGGGSHARRPDGTAQAATAKATTSRAAKQRRGAADTTAPTAEQPPPKERKRVGPGEGAAAALEV